MTLSEYSEQSLAEFKQQLELLQAEFVQELSALQETSQIVELDQPTQGRLTRMNALQEQEMAKANKQHVEQRLLLIKAALRRINAGEYGHCLNCEEPIDPKRLHAAPESAYCLNCQAHKETH